MKRKLTQILAMAFVAASAHTAYPLLSIGPESPCWDGSQNRGAAYGTFKLPGVNGTGFVLSAPDDVYVNPGPSVQTHFLYSYQVDLSGMSAPTTHCIKLVIHFGQPLGCSYDVMLTPSAGSVNPTTAGLGPFGDITFLFGSGCLSLGQVTTDFSMLSDSQPKGGTVTVIDDYTDPASGLTNETRIDVAAVVPDIPPNWTTVPVSIPDPLFQGVLYTNNYPPPSNGQYSLIFQLMDAPVNGLPSSQAYTQTVQVANGLFTAPLHFNPSVYNANPHWLKISVQPAGSSNYTMLNPPLPLTPTPQAMYAYSAGVVANLSPGQAVASLNGLTSRAIIQPGSNIQIVTTNDVGTNQFGGSITISAFITSDRNLKTDLTPVSPDDVLNRVAALPIGSWRFKNDPADVRHLGPMAQDFMESFGLGADNKTIGIGDEGGVALAAIQGLNQKLDEKVLQIQRLKVQNESLEKRLDDLEKMVKSRTEKN